MRVEVLGGVERRRRWSHDDKMRIIEETLAPGAKVTEVARRNGIAASVVFAWRRQARTVGKVGPCFAPVQITAAAIQELRACTSKPVNVNFFVRIRRAPPCLTEIFCGACDLKSSFKVTKRCGSRF